MYRGHSYAPAPGQPIPAPSECDETARQHQHHERNDATEDDLIEVRVTCPDLFRDKREQHGAEDRAQNRALAADDRASDRADRPEDGEDGGRINEADVVGIDRPGDTGEERGE